MEINPQVCDLNRLVVVILRVVLVLVILLFVHVLCFLYAFMHSLNKTKGLKSSVCPGIEAGKLTVAGAFIIVFII